MDTAIETLLKIRGHVVSTWPISIQDLGIQGCRWRQIGAFLESWLNRAWCGDNLSFILNTLESQPLLCCDVQGDVSLDTRICIYLLYLIYM